MITTRDSINFQYSIIFGYSSYKEDLTAGNIIGPGKLARKKVKTLSNEVIQFLKMYNAMLQDFSGSEVFAIEFSLYNISEKESEIYPKSMILVPGKYKECESLLLALKPDLGYLNVHRSRKSLNNISELFFEIEEFSEHPKLNKKKQSRLLDKFADRFSQKLYGNLLEDKWNKKMIGLNQALPTDKEFLKNYATIKTKYNILWKEQPHQLEIFNQTFEKYSPLSDEKLRKEHLKYMISEPSAEFIIKNTLKLGSNLMDLVNTGTLDETQDNLIRLFLNKIYEKVEQENTRIKVHDLISKIEHICNELKVTTNKYLEYLNKFLKSGKQGTLNQVITQLDQFIKDQQKFNNEDFKRINKIFTDLCKVNLSNKDTLRAIDLKSSNHYFSEAIKSSFNMITEHITKFLTFRHFLSLNDVFEEHLRNVFEKEKKPAKMLANKIITRFKDNIRDEIEIHPLLSTEEIQYEEEKINKAFREILLRNLSEITNFDLSIKDIVSFAEILMDQDKRDIINGDIERFKKFSDEIIYLLSYILRYNTINLFIKDLETNEFIDPVMFANKFHRFLEKRIGGIKLEWKEYILEWIKDYASKFIKMQKAPSWNLKELYDDFVQYLTERGSKERNSKNFLDFLDYYIGQTKNDQKKKALLDFLRNYESCLGIKTEFPKYIRDRIEKQLEVFEFPSKKEKPINYLIENEEEKFYNYIVTKELKYYSKLVPRPYTLILKHQFNNEERENFRNDLYHNFNFKFFKNNIKINISDNFKEVYKKWAKK
ncbi:MAG: hypothetical protein R6U96_11800 [Promethearchaeia archaeon]